MEKFYIQPKPHPSAQNWLYLTTYSTFQLGCRIHISDKTCSKFIISAHALSNLFHSQTQTSSLPLRAAQAYISLLSPPFPFPLLSPVLSLSLSPLSSPLLSCFLSLLTILHPTHWQMLFYQLSMYTQNLTFLTSSLLVTPLVPVTPLLP